MKKQKPAQNDFCPKSAGDAATKLKTDSQQLARITITLNRRRELERAAITRNKIQLGGLLTRLNIIDRFNISLGDDLTHSLHASAAEWLQKSLSDLITGLNSANEEELFIVGDEILQSFTQADQKTPIAPRSMDRKDKTRTLIQLGGIVWASGLAEAFGISPTADLQNDRKQYRPVAMITGRLKTIA